MGFHAVNARLERRPETVVELYVYRVIGHDERLARLQALADSLDIELQIVDPGRLHALAQSDEHQGVVALVEVSADGSSGADFSPCSPLHSKGSGHHSFCCSIRSRTSHNLGACIRSADASVVTP